MSRSTIAAVAVAALLCVAGVAGATGAATPGASQFAQTDDQSPSAATVDASATIENETLVVTVTADGEPAENVSVSYNDQTAQTGADGTASFAVSDDDEAEIELETDGFEGELEYGVADGSLTLLEEEYEYDRDVDADDDEDADEAEDEAEEDDEDDEDDDEDDDEAEEEAEEDDDDEDDEDDD
jgi:hypothetical protein